jgi:AcrR family transcriptional regulator
VAAPRDNLPIWARPEPGTRRPRFSREQIAAAALVIADTEGFAAVSMRRVATALGAGTMTLYHYVRTKDDLVALMDDALMGEALVPDGEMPSLWRPAITLVSHRTRAAIIRHPWALVSLRDAQSGPNAMMHFEQSLQAVANTGLSLWDRIELLAIVDDYVHGHLLRAEEIHTRTESAPGQPTDEIMDFAKAQLDTGRFPESKVMFEESQRSGSWLEMLSEEATMARFDRGLQALLDGLAHQMNLPDD